MNESGVSLRRRWLIAVVLGLGLGPLLVLWLRERDPELAIVQQKSAPSDATTRSTSAASRRAQARAEVSDEPEPTGGRQLPDCWAGLERTQRALTLGQLRETWQPLLAAQPEDPLVLRYLTERLSELVADDEARALEVLEAALGADPAEGALLLAGLRGADAVRKPAVVDRLVKLALDEKLDPELRDGLLATLETQRSLPGAAIDGLTRVARDDASGDAALSATHTLGRVMGEALQHGGSASAYGGKLLSIAAEANDEAVRALALEMPMVADVSWGKADGERIANLMKTDGSAEVRELAAQNLALGEDKQQVLAQYEAAFAREHDRCVRWALFRFAARAAGRQALPVMARMAAQDPRFSESQQQFEAAYRSGLRDFERVWLSLGEPDPVGCLHDDGDGT